MSAAAGNRFRVKKKSRQPAASDPEADCPHSRTQWLGYGGESGSGWTEAGIQIFNPGPFNFSRFSVGILLRF
jgi:hypothetical protein